METEMELWEVQMGRTEMLEKVVQPENRTDVLHPDQQVDSRFLPTNPDPDQSGD